MKVAALLPFLLTLPHFCLVINVQINADMYLLWAVVKDDLPESWQARCPSLKGLLLSFPAAPALGLVCTPQPEASTKGSVRKETQTDHI